MGQNLAKKDGPHCLVFFGKDKAKEPGMDGMSGMSGMDGMSGMSGMDGMSGMSGMDGMSGMSGMDGMSGMSGMDGNVRYEWHVRYAGHE